MMAQKTFPTGQIRFFQDMNALCLVFQAFLLTFVRTSKHVPELQDKAQFDIIWMGPLSDNQESLIRGQELISLKTQDQEHYKCIIPEMKESDEAAGDILTGTPPEELLYNVLSGNTKCSYRLEPYWNYEVCHGSHVRQFHEEKDSEGVTRIQEFYLGQSSSKEKEKGEKRTEAEDQQAVKPDSLRRKVQMMNVDGRNTPYFNQVIGNGTPCDLNGGQPRQVNIVYICHPSSNNEVMSVKETTTCEYEVIILNPHLCDNPAFKVKDDPIHQIKCHSVDGSPSRPTVLTHHELDSEMEKSPSVHGFTIDIDPKPPAESPTPHPTPDPTPEPPTDQELKDDTVVTEKQKDDTGLEDSVDAPNVDHADRTSSISTDDQLTQEFLAGDYCLRGGSGWWKYEFCYGKYISQYHEDGNTKTTIYLGYWDAETHLHWVKGKKKIKMSKYIVHFYSNGEMCDITGKPRNAQVKLKCKKGGQGQEMSIYLLEPSPCEYVVGVESPVLCPLIDRADENGLIDHVYL